MKKKCVKYIFGVLLLVVLVWGLLLMFGWRSAPTPSQDKIKQAYQYCQQHKMNTQIAIFVDYSVHSGKNRLLVYDFHKKKVILGCLCAHGCGGGSTEDKPRFCNRKGSNCSSVGLFKVGNYFVTTSYKLPAFRLSGLSTTNSMAYDRQILIHPWYTVSDIPVYPFHTPMNVSQGCFVISPLKFQVLKRILLQSNRPVLLSAYYGNVK